MNNHISVLDHGFVTLRNLAGPTRRIWHDAPADAEQTGLWDVVCGAPDRKDFKLLHEFDASDVDVANSARMSFDGQDQERSYEIEMKLNRYLLKNRHMTPFESIEVWLEMKLPIFVARQFVRHRTATLNEISGRYVILPEEWYIPEVIGAKSADKKQGQAEGLDLAIQEWFKSELHAHCQRGFKLYLEAVDRGVAPEHARIALGLGHYTHWLWKQDLRNMLHFLGLRMHSHAQKEAQAYANAIFALLEPHLPGIMGLYKELMQQP
ncbi:THY1 Predicted alternative thymidylate synthase [uncultured Caudovirales phage]|uniref:THY1 Predicted alternative thymidylate synthase n=1 Tax=uncultured Caudovirales phage TaxID=2100421 RepID=A0A6J5RJT9_9CAUD|nr:THY1 Predicted alternative thymidylate synthase [uncultured Caudovirales phage]